VRHGRRFTPLILLPPGELGGRLAAHCAGREQGDQPCDDCRVFHGVHAFMSRDRPTILADAALKVVTSRSRAHVGSSEPRGAQLREILCRSSASLRSAVKEILNACTGSVAQRRRRGARRDYRKAQGAVNAKAMLAEIAWRGMTNERIARSAAAFRHSSLGRIAVVSFFSRSHFPRPFIKLR
jgi:hypothetical protein